MEEMAAYKNGELNCPRGLQHGTKGRSELPKDQKTGKRSLDGVRLGTAHVPVSEKHFYGQCYLGKSAPQQNAAKRLSKAGRIDPNRSQNL